MLIIKFILVFSIFILCYSNVTTTPATLTTMPTSINNDEELQKAEAFSKAMTDMTEVFESKEPFGKNLKKLLDASRICGLVFHQGVYSWNQLQSNQEIQNVVLKIDHFYVLHINGPKNSITVPEADLASRQKIISIQKDIIIPITNLVNLFVNFRGNYFKKDDIDDLKTGCRWYDPEKILESIRSEIWAIPALIIKDDYSDKTYESLKKLFTNSLKQTLVMFPFCQNFLHGKERDSYRAFLATDTLKMLNTTFNKINAFRKEKFWRYEVIKKLVGKYVLNGPDKNILPLSGMEEKSENYKIQKCIDSDLFESYGSFGYNYHVTVNDAAQLGHNDTVLQCSTECHYFYNFLGKDIYVIRIQKAQSYQTCEHLKKFRSINANHCYVENSSTDSLEPLAKEIAEKCGEKIVAFSLIRDRLGVENTLISNLGVNGFSWLCDIYNDVKNDVNILIAFKPF